jgi:hypothetical protein
MKNRHEVSLRQAFRAQMQLVRGVARGRSAIAGAAALMGVLIIAAFNARIPVIHGTSGSDGGNVWSLQWFGAADFGLADEAGLMAVILAYIVACFIGFTRSFAIWRNEPPSNRPYFYSLPVNRRTQILARVAAGAVNVIVISALLAVTAVIGLLLGGRLSTLTGVGSTAWVSFILCPLILYLAASIATITCDRPGRVVGRVVVGVGMLYLLFSAIGFSPIVRVLEVVTSGPLSYSALLVNGFFPSLWQNAPAWADPGAWPLTVALWLGVTSIGIFSVASWYRE